MWLLKRYNTFYTPCRNHSFEHELKFMETKIFFTKPNKLIISILHALIDKIKLFKFRFLKDSETIRDKDFFEQELNNLKD